MNTYQLDTPLAAGTTEDALSTQFLALSKLYLDLGLSPARALRSALADLPEALEAILPGSAGEDSLRAAA